MARTFCIAIALLLCAAGAVVGEDSCSSSGSTVAVAPTDSVVEVRLVFVSFPDYAQQNLPTWADSLKNEFNAFIQSMSHGKQRFNISILTDPANSGKAWVANSNYINYSGQYGKLNREVMFRIKDAYSNPFSGVEELIIYHYRCAFPSAGCPGWGGVATLNITNAAADSVGFSGTGSTCRLLESGSINSAANKKYVFFNTGHEYGHNITINHSPNTFSPPCSSEDPNPYYVNMGLYGA